MSTAYDIASKQVLTRTDLQTLQKVSLKEYLNAFINNTVEDIDENIINTARLTNNTNLYHHFSCNEAKQKANPRRIDCRITPDITERLKKKYPDIHIEFRNSDVNNSGFYINWS